MRINAKYTYLQSNFSSGALLITWQLTGRTKLFEYVTGAKNPTVPSRLFPIQKIGTRVEDFYPSITPLMITGSVGSRPSHCIWYMIPTQESSTLLGHFYLNFTLAYFIFTAWADSIPGHVIRELAVASSLRIRSRTYSIENTHIRTGDCRFWTTDHHLFCLIPSLTPHTQTKTISKCEKGAGPNESRKFRLFVTFASRECVKPIK